MSQCSEVRFQGGLVRDFQVWRGMGTKPLRERIALPPEAEPERALIEALVENDEARLESE